MRNLSKGKVLLLGLISLTIVALINSCIQDLDVTPPIVTILHPANNDVVAGTVPILVTASDDEKLKEIRLFIDGVSVRTEGNTTMNFSWVATGVALGTHNIVAYAEDEEGNVGPSTVTAVTVVTSNANDQTPPVLTAISPADGTTFSVATLTGGILDIVADASDDSGIANVEFFIDGTSAAVVSAAPYSFAWDVTAEDRTTHTVFIKATDNSGNSSVQLLTVILTD